jgi:hypothetical protein
MISLCKTWFGYFDAKLLSALQAHCQNEIKPLASNLIITLLNKRECGTARRRKDCRHLYYYCAAHSAKSAESRNHKKTALVGGL